MSNVNPDPAIFRKAAEIIRNHGLEKGSYGQPGHARCAVGALAEAAGTSCRERLPETRFLADILGTAEDSCSSWSNCSNAIHYSNCSNAIHYGVPGWSDQPKITAADVVTMFEQCADAITLLDHAWPNSTPHLQAAGKLGAD